MTAYVLAAAVLPAVSVPPPGVAAAAWREALRQDTYDVVDDLSNVTPYLLDGPATAALDALAATGATIGAVLAGDVPDLPGLLVGKVLGSCEDRLAGVLPASDGRLVALATRLPRPGWLDGADLDTADGLDWLHARAPRGAVTVGPGWYRLAGPEGIARLDPRQDGWHATRALLSGGYSPS